MKFVAAAVAVTIVLTAGHASAQSFEITRSTIDGGGTSDLSGGGFTLSGTVGQPDAGGPLLGGNFALRGGFWTEPTADSSCPADIASPPNGVVDFNDLALLLGFWGSCETGDPCQVANIVADGAEVINFDDIALLLGLWGPCE